MNRFTSWRKATLRSMVRNLFIYESIRTTLNKAKATKPLADKLIGMAKVNQLSRKRRAFDVLSDHKLVNKLFDDIAPRFAATSGFTRIVRLGNRRGDNAELVIFELTKVEKKERPLKKKRELKPQETKAADEKPVEKTPETKPAQEKTKTAVKEKHTEAQAQKPKGKFLGGIRKIFKKERDSL